MKKIIALALVIVLTASVSILGTLAYLTDRDSKANVFTVGDVEIRLDEEFEQGSELIPGVDVEKEASITNTGDNDAWVWMTMAIPAALDNNDTSTVGEVNVLHWNVPGVVWKGYGDTSWATDAKVEAALNNGFITEDHIDADTGLVKADCLWTICQTDEDPVAIKQETIDGVLYNVYTFLYNGVLAAGDTTPVALHKVYLDTKLDINPDGQWHIVEDGVATEIDWNSNEDGNPIVYVSAYAMQTEGFNTVLDAYNAYQKQWGTNGAEYADPPIIYEEVKVTAADFSSIDFTQNNTKFVLSGDFEDLTIDVQEGLNQIYDGSGANFIGENTVTINAPGVAHAYSTLDAQRSGNVTVTGFEVQTLNVLAYNNETVTISDNKVNSMSVIGGNFNLIIDGNLVDGDFVAYKDGEDQTNDYGISLRICDYELSITDNTITDTYSHAIGINGRQGEVSSDWGTAGADNKIVAFSGNNITLNTTYRTERGALKIWCDQVYAPYATSGHEPNAAAKALMADILADTTNQFTIGDGHTIFNIFDYKTSDGK